MTSTLLDESIIRWFFSYLIFQVEWEITRLFRRSFAWRHTWISFPPVLCQAKSKVVRHP